jgi:MFS family permease
MNRNISRHLVSTLRRRLSNLPTRYDIFRALNLNTFSTEEIQSSYDALRESNVRVSQAQLTTLHENIGRMKNASDDELARDRIKFTEMLGIGKREFIEYKEYEKVILDLGTKIDPKIWAVSISHLLAGVSIGIIVPCMPLLVNELNISPSFFGLIISAFGLSKLMGNIPSAHFVNTIGRKPLMVAGLSLCTLGVGGIGLSLEPGFGAEWIMGCRVVTGLGVSAFTAGAFMLLADVSTALNRARSGAPVMAGFNAGLAVGPALGGLLIQTYGISNTYFLVGALFATLTTMNHLLLVETRPAEDGYVLPSLRGPPATSISPSRELLKNALQRATSTWKALLQDKVIRDIVLLNTAYMTAMTGTQLTTLQLFMVGPALQFTSTEIGYTYAGMSVISVAMTQPVAYLADKHSKPLLSFVGCGLIATASLAIPFTTSLTELGMAVCPLALGTTILGSVPNAHIVNTAPREDRAQAQSLLRTCGDVGMLIGGSTAGIIGELTSVETAMRSNGFLLLTVVAYLGSRHAARIAAENPRDKLNKD